MPDRIHLFLFDVFGLFFQWKTEPSLKNATVGSGVAFLFAFVAKRFA